ncbi:GLPGLI family protein [Chryseobacterium sp. T1]
MKFYSIFFFLFQQLLLAQQIKVEYLFIPSDIASSKETLYISSNKNKSISIQDSLSNIKMPDEKVHRIFDNQFSPTFYSDLSNNEKGKTFIFTESIGRDKQNIFLVEDPLVKIVWEVDEKSQKKILNYLCFKATTNFRGRMIEVYFTKDLPYSAGPFKFYGLPGLILEAKVVGLGYYMWKAVSIDLKNKDNVSYHPPLDNINIIDIQEYVRLYDRKRQQFFKGLPTQGSPGGIRTASKERSSLEKTYDWE